MKANHNRLKGSPYIHLVVSKIVEKKNESKSQLGRAALDASSSCVKDR